MAEPDRRERPSHVERPVAVEYTAYSMAKGQTIGDAVPILVDLFARRLYR